jgi:hypothetical protein
LDSDVGSVFGLSDAINIEPDETNISLNGFATVPNVAPCAVFGIRFPPISVTPSIKR